MNEEMFHTIAWGDMNHVRYQSSHVGHGHPNHKPEKFIYLMKKGPFSLKEGKNE